MPSLTDVYLTSEAFYYKNDVTITGSTHFIPLSRIDIGALQRFFSSSPAKTPPSDDCCLILSPLSFNKQLTSPTHHHTTTETPSPKAPHNGDWAHLPLTPRHHTHSPSGRDEDSRKTRFHSSPSPYRVWAGLFNQIPPTRNHFAAPACSNPRSL